MKYRTVTPYIMVRDARAFLEFAKDILGARVLSSEEQPDGRLGHTQIEIGDSMLMLADSADEWPTAPGAFYVYVSEVDDTYRRALEAGAESIMEPADQSFGDRFGGVRDRWGNQWWLAAPVSA